MIYIIDSSAWIEYFIGSTKGEIVKNLILNEKNRFLTVECCLAEIKGWSLRNNKDFNEYYSVMRANSNMLSLNENDWVEAADEWFEQRKKQKDFGLIDSVVLTKQKELNCGLVTGDKHFRDVNNVVIC